MASLMGVVDEIRMILHEEREIRAEEREEEKRIRAEEREEEKRIRAEEREEEKRIRAEEREEEKKIRDQERAERVRANQDLQDTINSVYQLLSEPVTKSARNLQLADYQKFAFAHSGSLKILKLDEGKQASYRSLLDTLVSIQWPAEEEPRLSQGSGARGGYARAATRGSKRKKKVSHMTQPKKVVTRAKTQSFRQFFAQSKKEVEHMHPLTKRFLDRVIQLRGEEMKLLVDCELTARQFHTYGFADKVWWLRNCEILRQKIQIMTVRGLYIADTPTDVAQIEIQGEGDWQECENDEEDKEEVDAETVEGTETTTEGGTATERSDPDEEQQGGGWSWSDGGRDLGRKGEPEDAEQEQRGGSGLDGGRDDGKDLGRKEDAEQQMLGGLGPDGGGDGSEDLGRKGEPEDADALGRGLMEVETTGKTSGGTGSRETRSSRSAVGRGWMEVEMTEKT